MSDVIFTLKGGRKALTSLSSQFLRSIYLCPRVALLGVYVPAALVFSVCGLHAGF